MSKNFKLGQVLTVTSGVLLCSVDELYEILNYLTNDNLYTHQLPRAAEIAKPQLLAKFPELNVLIPEINTEEQVEKYIDDLINSGLKKEYLLEPVNGWTPRDPIIELVEMMNKK